MTDADLVRKRLAFIETCLRELAELSDPRRVEHDVRERRFVEHTLQRAMAGFRNVLVHGYIAVDPAIVRDVLERRVGDIEAFVQSIRERLDDVSSE